MDWFRPVWQGQGLDRSSGVFVMRVLMSAPSGLGHVNPLVPLVIAFLDRGDDVVLATAEPSYGRVRALGIQATEIGLAAPDAHALALERFPELRDLPGSQVATQMFPRLFGAVCAESSLAGLLEVAREFRPHVMVHDAADFAAPIVAAAIGVPNVCQGFGFAVPPERVQQAADRAAHLWVGLGLEAPPFGGCFDHLYIDPYPPSLQPGGLDHIGRIVRRAPEAATAHPDETLPEALAADLADPDVTFVHVTFGTVYNRSPDVAETVRGAARLDAVLLVTTGPGGDVTTFGDLGPRAHVHTYVSQALVLPRATVVASHAGSGTLLGALAHGVPQLCVPQAADQFRNASAVSSAGAGRQLIDCVDADTVEQELRFLMTDPTTRTCASALAEEIRSMPTSAHVADVIAELAAETI